MRKSQALIRCPKCQSEFSPTDELSKELEKNYAEQLKKQIEEEKKILKEQITEELTSKTVIHLKDLQAQVAENKKRLEESEKSQLELLKKNRELQEKSLKSELETQKQLEAQRTAIREEAIKEASERLQLKLNEKDLKLESMTRQIEELKRKAEQGSQQAQGDAFQLEVDKVLTQHFPMDRVEPVEKGKRGADFVHTVLALTGKEAGVILVEAKNTKNWGSDWLDKAKEDQQRAKALFVVIVSEVLPKGVRRTAYLEGVWVTDFAGLPALELALRLHVLDLHQASLAALGKGEKLDLLYKYMTENEFKQRMEAAIGSFQNLQDSLQKEKAAMGRIWAYREKCHEQVLSNVTGLVGDIQGIIGRALPTIAALELAPTDALPAGSQDETE